MKKSDKELINKINETLKPIEKQNDLPEGLKPENIKKLLSEQENVMPQKESKKMRKINFRYITTIAAIFILILGIGIFKNPFSGSIETSNTVNKSKGIEQVSSYGKIQSLFIDMKSEQDKNNKGLLKGDYNYYSFAAESATQAASSENNSATDSKSTADSSDYSSTNIQVNGVDEADILKNDGSYLYSVSQNANKITIIKATPANEMSIVSTIKTDDKTRVKDIYVTNNKLIAVCYDYSNATYNNIADDYVASSKMSAYSSCWGIYQGSTKVYIYDISDKSKPELKKSFKQDGTPITSRMTGGKLYVLSNYQVSLYQNKSELKGSCIPSTSTDDGKNEKIEVDDICIMPNNDNPEYLIVCGIDTEDLSKDLSKKAVLGGTSDAYCTTDTLYASRAVYKYESNSSSCNTEIYKFNLKDGAAEFVCSGKVSGYCKNQFSLDEYDGYLRIATTEDENKNGSNVYVLDSSLNVVGSIKSIASGESIFAVRFIKDKGYVVTYEQTDPLFVIDLSNPKSPQILSELKLPGFSEYLHPYSDSLLIGIGEDTDESGASNGLKISLFDISDSANPKEIDKFVIKDAYSDVSCDYKAFLMNQKEGWFGIPNYTLKADGNPEFSFITFNIADNKIVTTGDYKNYDSTEHVSSYYDVMQIRRGAYIGDTLYTVSDGRIMSFSLKTGEQISKLDIDVSNN